MFLDCYYFAASLNHPICGAVHFVKTINNKAKKINTKWRNVQQVIAFIVFLVLFESCCTNYE